MKKYLFKSLLLLAFIGINSCDKKDNILKTEDTELFPKEFEDQGKEFLKENMLLSNIINTNNFKSSIEVINYLNKEGIELKYNSYENIKIMDKDKEEINNLIRECLNNSSTKLKSLSEKSQNLIKEASSYLYKKDENNFKIILKDKIKSIDNNEKSSVNEYLSKVYYNYLSLKYTTENYSSIEKSHYRTTSLGCWWGVCVYHLDWCLGGFCFFTDLGRNDCDKQEDSDASCALL